MLLHNPVVITPRLMAGFRIGDGWISIGYSDRPGDNGRTRFVYHIDTLDFEHTGDDLQSGCCGGSLQSGLESLLAFLAAAAESEQYQRTGRESDNSDLFPANVLEWAAQNSDEIGMLQCELEDSGTAIEE